jgi:membrane-associated protein
MTDLQTLIQAVGYLGVTGIVFAESGLLVGFFLPGDSLLFTAGFLASQGYLDVYLLAILVFVAAVLGNSLGYYFGFRFGPAIFVRQESLLFSRKNVDKAEAFFNTHGARTVILSRFIPVVRTFVPIVAGIASMDFKKFTIYNIIGGLIWGPGLIFLGYYLGNAVPDIDKYILPIVGAILFVSILPGFIQLVRSSEVRQRIFKIFFRKRD